MSKHIKRIQHFVDLVGYRVPYRGNDSGRLVASVSDGHQQ